MAGLDQSLRAFTAYRLLRATTVAMAEMNVTFAKFGLRRTTFSTLALVVEHPGLRQGQLAEALAIDRPNFVQIVDELELAKLVQRKTALTDKRAYALHATPKGSVLYEQAAAAVGASDQRLMLGLSPDQIDALHDTLKVIDRNAKHARVCDAK